MYNVTMRGVDPSPMDVTGLYVLLEDMGLEPDNWRTHLRGRMQLNGNPEWDRADIQSLQSSPPVGLDASFVDGYIPIASNVESDEPPLYLLSKYDSLGDRLEDEEAQVFVTVALRDREQAVLMESEETARELAQYGFEVWPNGVMDLP